MAKKIAIVVEGYTELIFIREYLCCMFDYNVFIRCISILRDNEFDDKIRGFGDKSSENHFYLLNANSDVLVVPQIIRMEDFLFEQGYQKIIGLRDMFSKKYKDEVPSREIIEAINQEIIEIHEIEIRENTTFPDKIKICFAIMETEAWFLGLHEVFEKIDKKLTVDFINKELEINLQEIDPETEIFHPATLVKKIYKLVDKNYGKHASDTNTITGKLTKEDYEILLARDKCNSFNTFHETIFPQA